VSRPAQMLASVYDVPLAERKATPLAGLMDAAARNAAGGSAEGGTALRGRTRIWEINAHLHCSIIGTCLTPGELRRLLLRLKVVGADTAGDHDAHILGVLLAGRPKEGAKLLQKALDRRHRTALNRFAKAPDQAALCALWEEAMGGGDIPGAYWALLTHPLATNHMVQHAFGDVHMLLHLVGATNRADLGRLRELERQNAALTEKLERQQRQLRDGFVSRDAMIHRLSEEIARGGAEPRAGLDGEQEDTGALQQTIAALQERLGARASAARSASSASRPCRRNSTPRRPHGLRPRANATRCKAKPSRPKRRSARCCAAANAPMRMRSRSPDRRSSISGAAPARCR
jgi:hypothetical protein